MPANETIMGNDPVSDVCSHYKQIDVNYFIKCIKNGRLDIVHTILGSDNCPLDTIDGFISTIEEHIHIDKSKVETLKQALKMTDDEMIDFGNTILRHYDADN